jgi:hypothetical protein
VFTYLGKPRSVLEATKTLAAGLDDRGVLEPGKLAHIQVWDIPAFEDVVYRLGDNAVVMIIKRGKVVHTKEKMIEITGHGLTIEQLEAVARRWKTVAPLSDEVRQRM